MKQHLFSLIIFVLVSSVFISNSSAKILRIGSMIPLTGPYASDGEQIKNGAITAIAVFEDKGGIRGYDKIELFLQDTACDPKQAVAVTNNLINLGVVGVIGAYCSSSTIPASELLAEQHIIMITPASSNPKVTSRGLPNMFRLETNDDPTKVASATLKYIKKNFNAQSIFVISGDEHYDSDIASKIKEHSRSFSLNFKGSEKIIHKSYNFSTVVRKAQRESPDVISISGMELRKANRLILELRKRIQSKIIISTTFPDFDTRQIDDSRIDMDGVFIVAPPSTRRGGKIKSRITEKFREPNRYAFQAYDATMVLLKAIRNAGSTDSSILRHEIIKMDFSGVSRRIAFNESGDLKSGFYLYQIRSGQAEVVDCPDDEKQCCDYCIAKNDRCDNNCN